MICKFKGYSDPLQKYWEGEAFAAPLLFLCLWLGNRSFWTEKLTKLDMVSYSFDEGKLLTDVDYKEAGPQVFWNRVVDYIV